MREHKTGSSAPSAPGRWRPGWIAGALSLVAMAGVLLFALFRGERAPDVVTPASPEPRPLTVVILEVEDGGAVRWPRKLLREWLAWKLGTLPEVRLLSEADFAAGQPGAEPPLAIFLSSGSVDDAPGQVRVHARFRQDRQDRVLEARGTEADMPAQIDVLAGKIVAQLVPRPATPSPAIGVDAAAARRYAEAVDAIRRRDSIASAQILGDVVEQAPRFGLARLQLAQALNRLGRRAQAIREMDTALSLLRPAPPETLALFEAQRLAIDPRRSMEAERAFAALSSGAARKPAILLLRAELLLDGGQPRRALALLDTPGWEHLSLGTRIARLRVQSSAYQLLGDPERMRAHARQAERLAHDAGKGWELERGMALLLVTAADARQHGGRTDISGYLEAASLFDTAGNGMAALYARFLAAAAQPSAPGFAQRLEALLAQARAGGYASLETEILMRVAGLHHGTGDLDGYRKYLEQALASANTAGDTETRNRLDTVLLFESYRGLRLEDADLRLQRLRENGLEGETGLAITRIGAAMDALRGRLRSAQELLSVDPRAGTADEHDSDGQLALYCDRASIRMQLGDLPGAKADAALCGKAPQPHLQSVHLANRVLLALIEGDTSTARPLLEQGLAASEAFQDGPDRWGTQLTLAALWTRAGDATTSARIYARVEPKLAGSGFRLMQALLLAGQAENAAIAGDWTRARQLSARTRDMTHADLWMIDARLALLDAADALAHDDHARASALAIRYRTLAQQRHDAATREEFESLLARACRDACTRLATPAPAGTAAGTSSIDWLLGPHAVSQGKAREVPSSPAAAGDAASKG